MIKNFFTFCLLLTLVNLQAQNFWTKKDETKINLRSDDQRTVVPEKYHVFSLNLVGLKDYLKDVPMEGNAKVGLTMEIPMSNGKLESFEVFEAPSMQAGLAAKYPSIKSYKAYSKSSKMYSARFAVGPNGFYAAINAFDGEKYIDPYSEKNIDDYIVYEVKDHKTDIYANTPMCGVQHEVRENGQHFYPMASRNAGLVEMRVFKLAMACTGEWGNVARRRTVEKCLADMNVMLTRMNAIYEKEMAMRFIMIDDNDKLIFLDGPSDPYTDPSGGKTVLPMNTSVVNARVASNSYDIGHVLHICNDIGGVAQGGSACQSNKANGVTCNNDNDLTNIVTRVMAHEVGHQFDASHTWNICQPDDPSVDTQRAGSYAYEPGSGSTIMSYAGTCSSDNVISDNDDYFHVASLDQMYKKTNQGGNAFSCSDKIVSTNHFPEVKVPSTQYTIPISTPFELRGSATDEDNDVLTYCWEQYDLGPKVALGTNGSEGPLFRSNRPSSTGEVRFFPRPNDILSGNFTSRTEVLPNVSRDLNFRLTVRDNNAQVGGVVWNNYKVAVSAAAGPFVITFPAVDARFKVGQTAEVTWDVANTNVAPVNCKFVNVYGSFSSALRNDDPNLVPLAVNVPNDGSQMINIPNKISNFFRIVIKAADNIFLTSSRLPSRIEAATAPAIYVEPTQKYLEICQPQVGTITFNTEGLAGYTGDINFKLVSGLPSGATASFDNATIAAGGSSTLSIINANVVGNKNGTLIIKAYGQDVDTVTWSIGYELFSGDLEGINAILPANGAEDVTSLPRFEWSTKPDSRAYEIQIATNTDFSPASLVFTRELAVTTLSNALVLDKKTIYYWRVRAKNGCRSGEWSNINAFISEALTCKNYASGEQSITIPTGGTPTVELPLVIAEQGLVNDLNIKLIKAEHSRLVDVVAYLVAPSGKQALLWSRQCGTQQNINIGLDDQSPDFFTCPINTGKLYRTATNNPTTPAQRLDIFNGDQMQGTWKLRIEDKQAGSGGKLQELTLEICSNLSVVRPVIIRNDTLKIHPKDKLFITDALLLTTDNDNNAAELVYTLVTGPSKGSLTFNGSPIVAGARFTQADINSTKLRYESASSENANDQFSFTVSDGQGGWVSITNFEILVDANIPSGVNDINISQDVFMFPNPTASNIQVVLSGNASVLSAYNVTDISGRLLFKGQLNGLKTEINTEVLSNGVYFISLTDCKRTVSKKLVKI